MLQTMQRRQPVFQVHPLAQLLLRAQVHLSLLDQLLLFIAAGLLLNLTPGPDVLYIVTHTLRSGLRAGIVARTGDLTFNVGKDLLSFAGQSVGITDVTGTTIFTTTAPTELTFAPANGQIIGTQTSKAYFVPGSYNSSTGVFTYSATGTSSLFAFNDDGGYDYAVVLQNYIHTTTKQDSTDAVTLVANVDSDLGGNATFTGILGVA